MKDQARDALIFTSLLILLFVAFAIIAQVLGQLSPSSDASLLDEYDAVAVGAPQNEATRVVSCSFRYDVDPFGHYCEVVLPEGSEPLYFVAIHFENFEVRAISFMLRGNYLDYIVERYGEPSGWNRIGRHTASFCWTAGVYASVTDLSGDNSADHTFFSVFDPATRVAFCQ